MLLDTDLAALYGVTTKALNQVVKRNVGRFPADFIFRLTERETGALNRSQNGEGSRFSVDGVTVADDVRPEADQGGRPQQDGMGIRAGTTTAEHFPYQPAHGFDGVGGPWQVEFGMVEVGAVVGDLRQERTDVDLHAARTAVALGQPPELSHGASERWSENRLAGQSLGDFP